MPPSMAMTPAQSSAPAPLVGIVAIQGDVAAHAAALERAGARPRPLLRESDLAELAAVVLPGGESTAIAAGMRRLDLYGPLRRFAAAGRPVLGTCAGAILMARRVENRAVPTLELLDLVAHRNAYGSQVASFSAPTDPDAAPGFGGMRCTLIRAPRLAQLGPGVEVLARVGGEPVLVRQGLAIAATFHPELSGESPVHRLLVELAQSARAAPRAGLGRSDSTLL